MSCHSQLHGKYRCEETYKRKQSLRVPGLEPPFSGNIESCGWELTDNAVQKEGAK